MNEQTSGEKVVRNTAIALGIICILLGVVSVGTIVYYQSRGYQISLLISQIEDKDSQISSLISQMSSKDATITDLNSQISSKNFQYNALQSEHNTLQISYNSLHSKYDSLQSNYNSSVSSYSNLRTQVNNRVFGTNGGYFITPQDSGVKNLVIQVTGGWSNTLDWEECWSDIKLMYDWVVNNIEYRSDGLSPLLPSSPSGNVEYRQGMWQLPSETLNLKEGDCEDMAILLTSLILSYNEEKLYTECIGIKGSISGHAAVQLLVAEDRLTILDPAGKYYTQTSGYIDSKDISTEINNWLNIWKPQIGNDVHVDRVFSDYLDKSFSLTSEYTSWMYSR